MSTARSNSSDPLPRPRRIPPDWGQESAWDYPRPPAIEGSDAHVQVWFNGRCIADSSNTVRVLETGHPPVFYIPLEDCDRDALDRVPRKRNRCEFKGRALWYDIQVGDRRIEHGAWRYVTPKGHFDRIEKMVAFYPQKMDRCLVDGEEVRPQPGEFYGGWITDAIVGPFKGAPGTEHW